MGDCSRGESWGQSTVVSAGLNVNDVGFARYRAVIGEVAVGCGCMRHDGWEGGRMGGREEGGRGREDEMVGVGVARMDGNGEASVDPTLASTLNLAPPTLNMPPALEGEAGCLCTHCVPHPKP